MKQRPFRSCGATFSGSESDATGGGGGGGGGRRHQLAAAKLSWSSTELYWAESDGLGGEKSVLSLQDLYVKGENQKEDPVFGCSNSLPETVDGVYGRKRGVSYPNQVRFMGEMMRESQREGFHWVHRDV